MLGAPPINSINRSLGAQIIGVCKDYFADDLSKKIAPAYHRINRDFVGCFWAKLRAGQSVGEAMDKIKLDWKKLTGGEPFNYAFLDEEVAKSYDAYRRWMKTITICSLISILIACMGLFGISGLTAVNRVKEIGIRKVLGASTRQLFLLLNRGTVIIMILSFMLAMPLAIYLSNEWLQNFAYRIKPDWKLYATAGIINVCTALVAVSYHTIRAATANPVKSLRTE
jgi:putative ABC transport system permease protein